MIDPHPTPESFLLSISTTMAVGTFLQAIGTADLGFNAVTNTKIADDAAHLHGENGLTKDTNIDEKGQVVNGRGDTPNRHDIITGSNADGSAFTGDDVDNCSNWTGSGEGSAGERGGWRDILRVGWDRWTCWDRRISRPGDRRHIARPTAPR